MGKNQYVVPTEDGWAVRAEKSNRVTKKFDNKQAAIKKGIEIAKNQGSELTILKKDGTIQNKNSYGNDPNPPKDKKP